MKNIIVIPAYNPDEKLIILIGSLHKNHLTDIIVVDDGSVTGLSVFDSIKSRVTLLKHEINMGKGAAIKTALKYISDNTQQNAAVCTIDADGQHSVEDALKVLGCLKENPDSLVLGVRTFSGDIPRKSRWGNNITKFVFRILCGFYISDTQTGLRAFGSRLIPFLLEVGGERYEYEMNMLSSCVKNDIRIKEISISTIYTDSNNSSSHFRAVRDSMRIYGNLLLFAGSSFICFIVDFVLMRLFSFLFGLILADYSSMILGNTIARVVSSSLNYYLNSNFVFGKPKSNRSALQYYTLVVIILIANNGLLSIFTELLKIPEALSKIITELVLFFASFLIQKKIIFKKPLKR